MPNVLVVGPSWVGDMVMAQSLFKQIKHNSPESEISVLAPSWSEPILQRMPEVSDSITMPVGHGSLQLGLRRQLGHKLKAHSFDQAIVLPGSFKSALIPWFASIPLRTGFIGEQRWGLLNDIRRLDKQNLPTNVQRYVALALSKYAQAPENPLNPQLIVDKDQAESALQKFDLDINKPVIAMCPGAEFGPAKRWPERHFAEVAKRKTAEGWQVWIFGSEQDKSVGDVINQLSGGQCRNLCGQTSLGEAVDLMAFAKFAVTNDSGLMHIAAAIGCHVIALYGSSSDEFTPPLTDKCHRLNLNLDCSPCFKRQCPLGHFDCMNKLSPTLVSELIFQNPEKIAPESAPTTP